MCEGGEGGVCRRVSVGVLREGIRLGASYVDASLCEGKWTKKYVVEASEGLQRMCEMGRTCMYSIIWVWKLRGEGYTLRIL